VHAFTLRVFPVQSAFYQVFLYALIRGPQVVALILPAAWRQDLRFGDRLMLLPEPVRDGGFRQGLLCGGGNSSDCIASRFSSTRSNTPSTS
jgi:hypothetical protein